MNIHVVARRVVGAAMLSASIAAVTLGSAATADAAPTPLPLDKKGPVSFCTVVNQLPVVGGKVPFCQKKTPEKMEIPGGPITVPIEN